MTALVTPWSVRSPVASTRTDDPSAGTAPRSIGAVSAKVAVGNWSTCMIRPLNWPSRRESSLLNVVMSTVSSVAVTVVPDTVIVPVIELVRPAPAVSSPASVSFTR